jgi:transcriptional regulator with XRE-family HTH domain
MQLRAQGISQQEVARRLTLDRSFVSRLETIGELRKGKKVAVIGFPIKNKDELLGICQELGLDFTLILNDAERWALAGEQKALDFFNRVMEILAGLRDFDALLLITSEKWRRLAEALFDLQIIYINLGPTPLQGDCAVDPVYFREILASILEN